MIYTAGLVICKAYSYKGKLHTNRLRHWELGVQLGLVGSDWVGYQLNSDCMLVNPNPKLTRMKPKTSLSVCWVTKFF